MASREKALEAEEAVLRRGKRELGDATARLTRQLEEKAADAKRRLRAEADAMRETTRAASADAERDRRAAAAEKAGATVAVAAAAERASKEAAEEAKAEVGVVGFGGPVGWWTCCSIRLLLVGI